MPRKTWLEKLHNGEQPEVKRCPKDIAGMKKGQLMLLPTAEQLDALIRTIPPGQAKTVVELRAMLAKQAQAEVTCPIVTGFCMRAVAEVAAEQLAAGAAPGEVAPVWRVLDEKSPTLAKLEGDRSRLLKLRRAEGL